MKLKKTTIEKVLQFVKFGIVGISNNVVMYVIYLLLITIGINYVVANCAGFALSIINAYYWNNRYVFRNVSDDRRIWWKGLIKTFVSYSFTGIILGNILLIIWVEIINISNIIAPLINLIITVPLNFIINKYWTFRK
jgi:putative flippase GtrA